MQKLIQISCLGSSDSVSVTTVWQQTYVFNRLINEMVKAGFVSCSIGLMTAAYVRGDDDRTRKMRRNIVRYCVLSQVLVFRDISMKVRKRFPTLDAVVAAG